MARAKVTLISESGEPLREITVPYEDGKIYLSEVPEMVSGQTITIEWHESIELVEG